MVFQKPLVRLELDEGAAAPVQLHVLEDFAEAIFAPHRSHLCIPHSGDALSGRRSADLDPWTCRWRRRLRPGAPKIRTALGGPYKL